MVRRGDGIDATVAMACALVGSVHMPHTADPAATQRRVPRALRRSWASVILWHDPTVDRRDDSRVRAWRTGSGCGRRNPDAVDRLTGGRVAPPAPPSPAQQPIS